jgi:hypothetical protein
MRNLSSQGRVHGLLRHPTINGASSKSPFGADSEAWKLTVLSQLINRARVNSEPPAKFLHRQDFIVNHLVRALGRIKVLLHGHQTFRMLVQWRYACVIANGKIASR